jgi:trans-2,3-dihydro-3-hydroxyanthranilate isomerase
MRYRFLTADVFTDRVFSGNPLAVFPDARGLSTPQMEVVAREFNLSETVFVFPPDDPAHTRRLRIFTPAGELPFAGHPTVGAAVVLAAIGEVPLDGGETRVVFEEGVGPVPVLIRVEGGRPTFAQLTAARPPEKEPDPPPPDVLARALSLGPDEVLTAASGYAPEVWSAGVPFLFVPVRDLAALGRARVHLPAWEPVAKALGFEEVFVFTTDAGEGADVRARMFAPGMGIVEDPATGGACSAFAGYLGVRTRLRDGTARWVVHQGVEMGRPSRLEVEADKVAGEVVAARVGGAAVLVSEGTMAIPDAA